MAAEKQKAVNSWLARQVRSLFAKFGEGYAPGHGGGGVVTQITSRTTAVVLNAWSGAITLVSAAGAAAAAEFTVTNNKIKATDTVILSQKSGADRYNLRVANVVDGAFILSFNTTGGTTVEQPVFNFAIVRAAID